MATLEFYKNKGINILNQIPKGWKLIKGAMTAPEGYEWIYNGKSLFSGEYEQALVKEESINKEVN